MMGWVSTSFLVIYAVSTAIYGKATERYSLKTLVIFAFSILVLSDLLGFFAVNYTMVLATRALQAVGTAVMPSLSMIIPARYVSLKDRGMAWLQDPLWGPLWDPPLGLRLQVLSQKPLVGNRSFSSPWDFPFRFHFI